MTQHSRDSSVSAKHYFLGTDGSAFRGAQATALLLDSGIGASFTMGGRLLNLNPTFDENMTHGTRIASLCAEGAEAEFLQGGPCGIAPASTILSANYNSFLPDRWQEISDLLRKPSYSADIIGLPWSATETHWLAHVGRAHLAALSAKTGTLLVAAAGHSGEDSVRFPATCPFALSVGVHGSDGLPAPYCGISLRDIKPEIFIPDFTWDTRLESGALATINGTSAAVAIIVGLGLLWCERLRLAGVSPSPAQLKALLLAAAVPSPQSPFRIVPPSLAFPKASFFSSDVCRVANFQAIAEGGTLRICVVASTPEVISRRWIYIPPLISIRVRQNGGEWQASGNGWCALDMDLQTGGFDLSVSIEGESPTGYIAGIGGKSLIRQNYSTSLLKRPYTVVGISASQSAAACVIRDGKVKTAVQLERVTRRKRDGEGFLRYTEAIDYCLDAVGIRASEVDVFAFNSQPLLPGWVGLSQPTADDSFSLFDVFGDRSYFVSHHLAHAFAAYAGSGFRRTAVLVCDGSGGSTLGSEDLVLSGPELLTYLENPASIRPPVHVSSIYYFENGKFRLLDREVAESFNIRCGATSIGEVYAAVSQYLFKDWQEGGKLMGLAAFGDANAFGPSLLERGDDGRLRVRRNWQNRYRHTTVVNPLDIENRTLSARVQRDLETVVLERVRLALEITGKKSLAYSGGIALNCAANSRILNETGVRSLFVFPASNDAGVAVGAAYAALAKRQGRSFRCSPWRADFLGYPYNEADCVAAIRAWRPWLRISRYEEGSISKRLANGQIIGWFEGGSEFGPRALGHRSILANPQSRMMRDTINNEIKHREDFRPFAPAIPIERASEFFEITFPSPYMLMLAKIRPSYRDRLLAVSHEDDTARVQTVSSEDIPRLHSLLQAFGAITGIPILLNTSLNVRGQPIVETPLEALELLLSTRLDGLVLGDSFIEPECASLFDQTSYVILSPATRVVCESSNGQPIAFLESNIHRERFELSPLLFQLLSHADGTKTIQQLMTLMGIEEIPTLQLAIIEAFQAERLVLARPGVQT